MAGGTGSPKKAILFAFSANFGIAIAKSVAAFFTGSSSMLAEAIHSYADTVNQLLLLLGMHRAKRPPDDEHPLGYGKVSYFWSFIVAIMLFSMGGLFSVYEGWHKLHATDPIQHVWIALLVLGFSIVLEGASLYGCILEVNKIRGTRGLWYWLHESRNSELIVVFGEDLGALAGLTLAFGFLCAASLTGDPGFDAYGSISIGIVLLVISVFLSVRVKRLLIGRSADPDLDEAIEQAIAADPHIREVFNVITVQFGPDVMVSAKIRLDDRLELRDACEKINRLEAHLQERFPEILWCFMEPDITDAD